MFWTEHRQLVNVCKILLKNSGWKVGNLLYVWNIISLVFVMKYIAFTLRIHKFRRISSINILQRLMFLDINSTPHLTCIPCSLYRPFIYPLLSPYFDQNTSRFCCGGHANLFWNKIKFLNVFLSNLETLTYAAIMWSTGWVFSEWWWFNICVYIHIYIYTESPSYIYIYIYIGCLQMNGAFSKVNKKFISQLTRAKRTPSAAATVPVSHVLITILRCVHPG